MKLNRSYLIVLTFALLSAFTSACHIYYEYWAGAPYLVGVSDLNDPNLCARIKILNESRIGETNIDNHRNYRGFNIEATLNSITADYKVFDGAPGKTDEVNTEGSLSHDMLRYDSVATFEIAYDQTKNPAALENPVFSLDLKIKGRLSTGHPQDESNFERGYSLKPRTRFKEELDTVEGLCGKEYRYRVRASYLHNPNDEEDKYTAVYETPVTDF